MWPKLLATPLKAPGQYVYSDLSMYMLKEVVEKIVGRPLDVYMEEKFYRPLGACTMGFCPWQRYDDERLVPTEIDGYFRKETLHGFVQDSGAALSGGVAGHAGLLLVYIFLSNRTYPKNNKKTGEVKYPITDT